MTSPESIAAHFGYTGDWLRLGIVTQAELQRQFAEFETCEDKNTEHYRCAAFRDYLNRIDGIADETLHELLALSDSGHDGCDLALNRAFELVRSDLLNNSQLQSLRKQPDFNQHSSFRLAVDRVLLDRRLTSDGLTDRALHDIRVPNDASTIRRLLDRDDLTRDHVAWIAEHACNKRLRNVAAQRLTSRRYRAGG
jgi:hypothetical protein